MTTSWSVEGGPSGPTPGSLLCVRSPFFKVAHGGEGSYDDGHQGDLSGDARVVQFIYGTEFESGDLEGLLELAERFRMEDFEEVDVLLELLTKTTT